MLKYTGIKKELTKHIVTQVKTGAGRVAKVVILKPFSVSVEAEPAVAANTGLRGLSTEFGYVADVILKASEENGSAANGFGVEFTVNTVDDLVFEASGMGVLVKLARTTKSKNTAALITAGIVALGAVLGVSVLHWLFESSDDLDPAKFIVTAKEAELIDWVVTGYNNSYSTNPISIKAGLENGALPNGFRIDMTDGMGGYPNLTIMQTVPGEINIILGNSNNTLNTPAAIQAAIRAMGTVTLADGVTQISTANWTFVSPGTNYFVSGATGMNGTQRTAYLQSGCNAGETVSSKVILGYMPGATMGEDAITEDSHNIKLFDGNTLMWQIEPYVNGDGWPTRCHDFDKALVFETDLKVVSTIDIPIFIETTID